jgi:hypothetical protein
MFSCLYILFNLYYFECMYDVIYKAESAFCNMIITHHLQLYYIFDSIDLIAKISSWLFAWNHFLSSLFFFI